MTQEEYDKRVYESTQRFAELFLAKEVERGNTWILSSGGEERRRSIIKNGERVCYYISKYM